MGENMCMLDDMDSIHEILTNFFDHVPSNKN